MEAAKPLEEMEEDQEEKEESDKLLRDEVVAEDIANVIIHGIPANKMLDTEKNKVLAMGSKLKERVVDKMRQLRS